jgi:serine/threonine protein kinase
MEGGMGVVSQLVALHDLSQCFALKTIKGANSIKDFDQECRTWLSVSHHPNIAKALAFGSWQNLPGVLIDWYDRSLSDFRFSEMTADQIATLLYDIAEGLGFAHSEAGIIHRDIKPHNILVDRSGRARVTDFGIARCMPGAARDQPRLEGGPTERAGHTSAAGTPFFMAPELWLGGQPSVASDIFSLGVTFFYLLTGSHPFAGPIGTDPVRRRRLLRDSIRGTPNGARTLADAVWSCISLQSSDRPSSYDEIAALAVRSGAIRREPSRLARAPLQIVAIAALAGATGSAQDAELILKQDLAQVPDDPILLCALADHHARTGNLHRCDAILIQCFSMLQRSRGVHNGGVHVRPAMVWASRLIDRQDWHEASLVIRSATEWVASPRAPLSGGIFSRDLGEFPEFGWYMLYCGRFVEAYEVLCKSTERALPTKQQLVWWIAAAALCRRENSDLDDIAQYASDHSLSLTLEDHDRPFALATWWLGLTASPVVSQHLPKVATILDELVMISGKYSVDRGSLFDRGNRAAHAALIQEIYKSITGRTPDEAALLLP